ncbi:10441_t:CDS:10 [Paraglomus brasilianum]|uniref:10441_t:CDS:1 n=1 Tax=Paraglomus brasilianum TaxID=144538 RepID=A0A9N9CSG9_9GLOM|nr:10441_t:CDS:10 [Paraglomus brasilianum]
MGRKDFIEDVRKLKEYFRGLNLKAGSLVRGFDFQDPELSFRFTPKSGRPFTVKFYVNVGNANINIQFNHYRLNLCANYLLVPYQDNSLTSYPAKFSGFLCVDDANDTASAAAARLQDVKIQDNPVSLIVATLVKELCDLFKMQVPKDLQVNALKRFAQTQPTLQPTPSVTASASTATSKTAFTPATTLARDILEARHFNYHAELLCADEIGFKVVVSIPVSRLGLSFEAYEAWNLIPTRHIVCTIQFSPNYINLQETITNALSKKAYLIGERGFIDIKEELKKQFPAQFTIVTSECPRGMAAQIHNKDDIPENDHFILSWTLTELLRSKFFDMLCDRVWFGLGWAGAEYADMKRNKQHLTDFLNQENYNFDECIDECLLQDQEQHQQLCHLDEEEVEEATASTNRNFLLLVLRYLRQRILLSTKYCLTCHYPHTESISSIRPFVCGAALCQHQALVGLGNLFEAALVNSPVVVDLLISLCYVAVSSNNLNSFPSKAIGATISTKSTVENSLYVEWSDTQGVIGGSTERGYEAYGWRTFDNQVQVNDLLEIYNPESDQPFALNRCSSTSAVRVLEVHPHCLVLDFQVVIPSTLAPSKPVYLPFRVCRREELNFLYDDGRANYELLREKLNLLPPVNEMVHFAQKNSLKADLDKIDPLCFPLLSWIISSNRTHLRLLESDEEKVQYNDRNNAYSNWKQFVMIMSSPEKEEIFQQEKQRLRDERRGQTLGELFAFHGSPLTNWHSIIRTSLNYNKVTHGRAFGDGVYHSLQAATSASYAHNNYYGRSENGSWKNSLLVVQKCMALCEIVNRPTQFISTSPHLVVKDESWITTRYLFVDCQRDPYEQQFSDDDDTTWTTPLTSFSHSLSQMGQKNRKLSERITLDSHYCPVWLNNQALQIPKRDFAIISIISPTNSSSRKRQFQYDQSTLLTAAGVTGHEPSGLMFDGIDGDTDSSGSEEEYSDAAISPNTKKGKGKAKQESDDDEDDYDDENYDDMDSDAFVDTMDYDDDVYFRDEPPARSEIPVIEIEDDGFDPTLLPLPEESSITATRRICQELRVIINKQDDASNDCGFYVNLEKLKSVYQWVVEMRNFDPSIPLAQDMIRHKVKAIELEVRFAPQYPYLPPYVRVIRPRLLRFMDGGGGHVTAGGSICMDLLTLGNGRECGWSSAYTMEAVLLQIKLALSSLDPRPARLDRRWQKDYSPSEAIDAYVRVANQHGWQIPDQWQRLFGH